MNPPLIAPLDTYNQALLDNVHPQPYENPTPSGRYNLVVIGAGTGGLVTAAAAAGLGAKVALIEKHLMGGDCLNVGCVPSKAIIRTARALHECRRSAEFGVRGTGGDNVDFGAAMERMRRLRAGLSRIDSAQRFRSLGVDVYIGSGRFTGGNIVEVDGKRLAFARAVVATGARAARLPIPGLERVDYVTNENVFWLTELPRRLVVLGAGPIGCELGQAFCRFGSDVTMTSLDFLPREDTDTAEIIKTSFRRDGIKLELGANITDIQERRGEKLIAYEVNGEPRTVAADQVLLGAGRAANVEDLGLEAVGVRYDKSGIRVDDYLRTTNPAIYAVGDVCSKYQFTHAADATARIVIQNSLFFGRKKMSTLQIPWCTYTDPEVAHVGLHLHDAEKAGIEATAITVELKDVDRAVLDGATDGFARAVLRKGTDKLLGLTIVAEHAGEMIGEAVLAMNHNIGLGSFANTIHPYPTQAEALRKLGDAYNRTRLTPTVKRLFEKLLAWRR
ncbi:MAG TPA: mercuric reductase [Candidatus Acidoferrales bacterium]|nr:mercuric reductase [Candidatus Acidoferrales bacterium]